MYIVTRFCCSLDPPFRPPIQLGPWLGADMLVVWGFWWLSVDRLPHWRLFLRGFWLHYGFHSLWVWCDGSPLGSLQYSGCRDPEWKCLLTRGRCLPTEMKIEWNFMASWKIDKIWRNWDITTTTCTDMIEPIFSSEDRSAGQWEWKASIESATEAIWLQKLTLLGRTTIIS